MSGQLTVSVGGEGPDAELQRAILATVPNDFRIVEGDADVLLVSGRDRDPAAALAAAGPATRAIMVTSPAALDAESRAQLARIEAVGTPVALGFAYAPWFQAEGLAFDAETDAEVAILDLTAHVVDAGAVGDALLELLHIARTMTGGLASTKLLMQTPTTTVIEAQGGPTPLKWRMTACAGLSEKLVVERIARERRSKVEIARDGHARPAQITHHDIGGSHLAGPVYQSGYRAGWLALHAALGGDGLPGGVVAQLASDLEMLPA
jgi:hypothetical protein